MAWGAKAIPEGGYWAMPRLHAPGMVIAGDAAGMVNVPKLKGIHYAIRSGMFAAETLYRQLKAGSSDFSAYEQAVHDSEIGKDLYESRNMKQPFGKGFFLGGAITNAMVVTKGRIPGGHWQTHRDADQELMLTDRHERYPKPDGKYTFDKLSGVFTTGNATRDDAPSHIRIQQRVPRELGEAWQWMCPAGVYEVPDDAPENGYVDLVVNPSNCVQCGAITAKGGRLTPPEGGDGPGLSGDLARGIPASGSPPAAEGPVASVHREFPQGNSRRELPRGRLPQPEQTIGVRWARCAASPSCSCRPPWPAPPPRRPPRPRRRPRLRAGRGVHARAGAGGAHGHVRGARARRARGPTGSPCASRSRPAGRASWTGARSPRRGSTRGSPPTTASAATATSRASATSRRRPRTGRSCASAGSTPAGEVIRTARHRSATCRQTDLRPDLRPRRVEQHPAANPRDRRYVVFVKNTGRTLAPPASVTLRAGDHLLPPGTMSPVLPGATRRIAFTAPACAAGDELEVTADATGLVDEADEDDNVLVVPCPPA